MNGYVTFIELNIRGAWVVHGSIGIRQYYGYSKEDAIKKYIDECKNSIFEEVK